MKHEYKLYFIGLAVTLLALGGAILWILFLNFPLSWDFRNNLYLPVYLLLQQQSPYNIHVLVDGSNAIWFPMAIGMFLPLGYLDLQQANNFWWLFNIGAIIALMFIAIEQKPPPLLKLVLIIPLIFLFPSTASHLFLGQISIPICLAFVVVIWFGEWIPVWLVGFLFAFTLTKPQLALVFIPTYFYAVQRERGWRWIWKLGLWTLVGIIVLCLPVIIIQPGWYVDFFSNLMINHTWAHPSIHTLLFLPLVLGGRILGWIYIGIGIGVAFYGVARLGIKEGLIWTLALTPVISPYIWSWDFVFLYPLMIYSIFQHKNVTTQPIGDGGVFLGGSTTQKHTTCPRRLSSYQKDLFMSALLFCGYFMVQAGFMVLKFTGLIDDSLNWWIPWSILGITFLTSFRPGLRKTGE